IDVLIYQEEEGETPPLVTWLDGLDAKARDRCLVLLRLLEEHGHELRRPHAENLGAGIYEMRVKYFRVNYRMLYFFHGRAAAVVSHGFAKERLIPPEEIKLAAERMQKFREDPRRHTFRPA